MNSNIFSHQTTLTRLDREEIKINKGICIWLTGLSGSGKSTIANAIEVDLNRLGIHTYLLDGDNIRQGLNAGLGFNEEDRSENIRRIGEVAKLFVDAGIVIITAFISPFEKDRSRVREILPKGRFMEVFVDTNLQVCEERDTKGLYKKARNNEIKEFTGISSPYDIPLTPELVLVNSEIDDLSNNTNIVIEYLKQQQIITITNDCS